MHTTSAGTPVKVPLDPAPRTARDAFWQRQGMKRILWVILPLVMVGGLFYPLLGVSILGCMIGAIAIAPFRGRAWCDICPRGAFFDVVMRKFSAGRPVPAFLRGTPFRVFMVALIMTVMITQLVFAWGDWNAVGWVFLRLLLITTLVGVVLAVPLNARTWCAFCPMGSMASWMGKKKLPLQVNDSRCTDCGMCARVCPVGLNPAASRKDGEMQHGDCLKCMACTAHCGRAALTFEKPTDPPVPPQAG
jgi:ferredoxin-type protein NapH